MRRALDRVWQSAESLWEVWNETEPERHLNESEEREIRLLCERFRDMWLCSTREQNLRDLFAQLAAARAEVK